jgi:hypothetical protein
VRSWIGALAIYLHSGIPTNNAVYVGANEHFGGNFSRLLPEPESVFTCPDYTRYRGIYGDGWLGSPAHFAQAYGYNANILSAPPAYVTLDGRGFATDGGLGWDTNGPVRESAIARPNQMIATGDSVNGISVERGLNIA